MNADRPENLLLNATLLGALNRNGLGLNPLWLAAYIYTIFTVTQLYVDPTYAAGSDRNWWQDHWKEAIHWIVAAVVLIITIVLLVIPGTQEIGIGLLAAELSGAMSGFIFGFAVGGAVSALQGNGFMAGATQGAVYGALDGFSLAAVFYGLGALADIADVGTGAADAKTFYTVQSSEDIARLRAGGEPWPTALNRGVLGQGVYAWGNMDDAQAYLEAIEAKGVQGLKIYEFTINNSDLASLNTFNMFTEGDDAANALLDTIDSTGSSGYQHIIKLTGNYGFEYFFDKSVIGLLNF